MPVHRQRGRDQRDGRDTPFDAQGYFNWATRVNRLPCGASLVADASDDGSGTAAAPVTFQVYCE